MRKSSRMAPKEKQTIEIEKTDRDPLLSFNQAVTVDCSDFLGTALSFHQKSTITIFCFCPNHRPLFRDRQCGRPQFQQEENEEERSQRMESSSAILWDLVDRHDVTL